MTNNNNNNWNAFFSFGLSIATHSELGALNFNVELDLFAEQVPVLGNITFTNIIGRLNPSATKYLALACHYDSKLFPGQVFYGAIDSAVPCSMMLNLVKTLQDTLDKNREDVSLMVNGQPQSSSFQEYSIYALF